MSSGKSVFIIGPGFIGWNVLDLLVAEGYSVTGLVRRKEHGQQVEESGATVVYGDLNDKLSSLSTPSRTTSPFTLPPPIIFPVSKRSWTGSDSEHRRA
jgi:nucleoside-diphosphate-sugar epimerase